MDAQQDLELQQTLDTAVVLAVLNNVMVENVTGITPTQFWFVQQPARYIN